MLIRLSQFIWTVGVGRTFSIFQQNYFNYGSFFRCYVKLNGTLRIYVKTVKLRQTMRKLHSE